MGDYDSRNKLELIRKVCKANYDLHLFEQTQKIFRFKDYLKSNGKLHLIDDKETREEFYKLLQNGEKSMN